VTRNLTQGVYRSVDLDWAMRFVISRRNRSLVVSSHSSMASTITLMGPTCLSLAIAIKILQSSLKF
jgi:hypothetical protein